MWTDNHTFRATGITAYLKNSGKLEVAQQIANQESPRTIKLYYRRKDEISLLTSGSNQAGYQSIPLETSLFV